MNYCSVSGVRSNPLTEESVSQGWTDVFLFTFIFLLPKTASGPCKADGWMKGSLSGTSRKSLVFSKNVKQTSTFSHISL